MPFVAINPSGGRVCTLDHDDLREQYKPGDLTCPLCQGIFTYKHGTHIRPHFAHKSTCTTDYAFHPESMQHLFSKASIRERLIRSNPNATVDLEVPFPDIMHVADILLTLNGWREVHEIQFSAITEGEIEQRTLDYESIGITVHWWLGGAAYQSKPLRNWSINRFGELLFIEVTNSAA